MPSSVELPLERHAALGNDVTHVLRHYGFDQHDPAFLVGNGEVAHAVQHNTELAGAEVHIDAVFKSGFQVAVDHEEQFIFTRVVMPDEFALELGDLDVLVIDPADDARRSTARNLFRRLDDLYSMSCEHDALRQGGKHRR